MERLELEQPHVVGQLVGRQQLVRKLVEWELVERLELERLELVG